MANLAIFFDGTWNTPTDRTNVHRLYKLLDELDLSQQQGIYIPGVGTQEGGLFASCKRYLGAAFGDGLSENILTGYRWLIDTYQSNDRIFIFGFSRGAYTARSLAGLIRNSGILRKENRRQIDEAYEMYRDKIPPYDPAPTDFRRQYSHEPEIDFIGVWDTVGALGIPINGFPLPGFSSYYQFHDTTLSDKVKAAYHALAINEFRSPYSPTFWTKHQKSTRPANQPVEQRWFVGAHCNVGGGYTRDKLCNLSARWIQKRAQECGLKFLSDWPVGPEDYKMPPRDSYDEFVSEHQALAKIVERVPRIAGNNETLGETVDPSVLRRIADDRSFLSTEPRLRAALESLPSGED